MKDDQEVDYDPAKSITAKHFLPDREDWNVPRLYIPDLNIRIQTLITIPINGMIGGNFGFIYCDWYHFDLRGVLTRKMFENDLHEATERFAKQIDQHESPFRPVRITARPSTEVGVAYFDWIDGKEGEYCFDLRTMIQFGHWVEPTTQKPSAGLRFWLMTMVQYDELADEAADDAGAVAALEAFS